MQLIRPYTGRALRVELILPTAIESLCSRMLCAPEQIEREQLNKLWMRPSLQVRCIKFLTRMSK